MVDSEASNNNDCRQRHGRKHQGSTDNTHINRTGPTIGQPTRFRVHIGRLDGCFGIVGVHGDEDAFQYRITSSVDNK